MYFNLIKTYYLTTDSLSEHISSFSINLASNNTGIIKIVNGKQLLSLCMSHICTLPDVILVQSVECYSLLTALTYTYVHSMGVRNLQMVCIRIPMSP